MVNYHGHAEFGKDLVFSEVDRFGAVRFHGLQAKFEDSISLNDTDDLIRDARQAFANRFRHPQTGTEECISTFYMVNAGSLGGEAVAHFFNSLRPTYGGNVQLLHSKDLLSLDRWASVNRQNDIGAVLAGIKFEVQFNACVVPMIEGWANVMRQGVHGPVPLERMRTEAISEYLARPSIPSFLSYDTAHFYHAFCTGVNQIIDGMMFAHNELRLDAAAISLDRAVSEIKHQGAGLIDGIERALKQLGPLAAS